MAKELSVYVTKDAAWCGGSQLRKVDKGGPNWAWAGRWNPNQTNYGPFRRAVIEAANSLRRSEGLPNLPEDTHVPAAWRRR